MQLRPGESENTLSVQRPQPHTTNPWKEEENKIGDTKERADHANRKALALLLKPASGFLLAVQWVTVLIAI